MSELVTLFTGDTWDRPITLKDDSGPANLSAATEIKCCVIGYNDQVLLQSVDVDKNEGVSNWGLGVIVPVFAKEDTVNITKLGNAHFQVRVTIDGRARTWPEISFKIAKGANS